MDSNKIRDKVREGYAEVAKQSSSCCGSSGGCCGGSTDAAAEISRKIGYDDESLASVPDGANLGLGCGNPVVLASLKEGETVLDLGSGGGLDCFLAADKVGMRGKVIGVDMTPEMLQRARANAEAGGYRNVEFRLGEIENLPAADASVDAIISNCVINLSPDKARVFQEAYRVLRPGGRLMVSDIVLLRDLPRNVSESMAAYVSCVAGAVNKEEYIRLIEGAGFRNVRIVDETPFSADCVVECSCDGSDSAGTVKQSEDYISSVKVEAFK